MELEIQSGTVVRFFTPVERQNLRLKLNNDAEASYSLERCCVVLSFEAEKSDKQLLMLLRTFVVMLRVRIPFQNKGTYALR